MLTTSDVDGLTARAPVRVTRLAATASLRRGALLRAAMRRRGGFVEVATGMADVRAARGRKHVERELCAAPAVLGFGQHEHKDAVAVGRICPRAVDRLRESQDAVVGPDGPLCDRRIAVLLVWPAQRAADGDAVTFHRH